MIIVVNSADVEVTEADDCGRLHVAAPGQTDTTVATALVEAGLGGPGDPGHAWLDVAALRELAAASATSSDWGDRFTSMIEYARSKGWMDGSGRLVAAHIDTSG